MALVRIPPQLRKLTGGAREITVAGATIGEVIDALEKEHPGIRDRVLEDDELRPGLAVAVDSVIATRGLLQPVGEQSEVTFVPAVSGG